jgi:hypothetical protein
MTCVGNFLLTVAQVFSDRRLSLSTLCSITLFSIGVGLLHTLRRHRQTSTALRQIYIYCYVIDVILTVMVLTETEYREIFSWFLLIPMLMLYGRGVKACAVAFAVIVIQTTMLRYLRESFDLTHLFAPSSIHSTIAGARGFFRNYVRYCFFAACT